MTTVATTEVRAELETIAIILAERIASIHNTRLIDIQQLSKELSVSVCTLRRLRAEGMPVEYFGTAERYDVHACREWARQRGRKSVTPKAKGRDADGLADGVVLKSRRKR